MNAGLMTLDLAILFVALLALLATNAFFVLAEFAIVKVRPSRVAQLAGDGDARARLLTEIQDQLDEYLSVCQVGITLASVALGMVGERTAQIIMGQSQSGLRYALAIAVSYLVISGSHILLGELVPKSVAIRLADRMALLCAKPLRFFHRLFFPALWLLTAGANAILRLIRVQRSSDGEEPSEKELRIILNQSQERGVMSFRRLLFMENIFDLGACQGCHAPEIPGTRSRRAPALVRKSASHSRIALFSFPPADRRSQGTVGLRAHQGSGDQWHVRKSQPGGAGTAAVGDHRGHAARNPVRGDATPPGSRGPGG
jgi:hypothetical protein